MMHSMMTQTLHGALRPEEAEIYTRLAPGVR